MDRPASNPESLLSWHLTMRRARRLLVAEEWLGRGFLPAMIVCGLVTACLVVFQSPANMADLFRGRVSGSVDERFVASLALVSRVHSTVIVSSGGGSAASGWRAGTILVGRNSNVILDGDCLSACAEFVLPAANSVSADKPVLIGLHGNDFMFSILAAEFFPGREFVDEDRLDWLNNVYTLKGLNRNFYKETMARLEIKFVSIAETKPLPQVEIYSVYSMWFPTSEQLRSLWGLEVNGPICADDPLCWKPRILAMGQPNEKFVVGDIAVTVRDDGSLVSEPWVEKVQQIRVAPAPGS